MLAFASPALAIDPVEADPAASEIAAPTVHRLSDEEVDRILAEAAERDEVAEGPERKIHGEFGVAIGTGGYRSAYGTAIVPLGKGSVAAFSFESSRNDPYAWYGHPGRCRAALSADCR